jgi:hypothetical protein
MGRIYTLFQKSYTYFLLLHIGAIFDQLTDFFNFHFHPLLSAFRKGFGCQTALLKIIEDWKKALDENTYIAAILMDLIFFFLKSSLTCAVLSLSGKIDTSIHL